MSVYKIIIQNGADHEVIEIASFVWKEDNLFLAYMYTYDYILTESGHLTF